MSFLRKWVATFVVLAGFAISAGAYAQDRPHAFHGDGTADVQTRSLGKKRALEEGAARAFARAYREAEEGGWDVQRLSLFRGEDVRGEAAVEAVVELRTNQGIGALGIFLGSRYADTPDQWILVGKDQLKILQEAAERAR